MSTYDDPSKALSASGERFRSGNAFTHHYKIDEKLRGFEVFVASSNNKAVENISAELPAMGAIAGARTRMRYFKSVADNVARGLAGEDAGAGQTDLFNNKPDSPESWGLIAAVLGNAKNRYAFRQPAWADQDQGLRAYLLEASGNPQTIEKIDPNTGRIVERRKPLAVTVEKPPANSEAALKRWKSARRRFLAAKSVVEERLTASEKGRRALEMSDLFARRRSIDEKLMQLETQLAKHRADRAALEDTALRIKSDLTQLERVAAEHGRNKPGILGRIFGPRQQLDWEKRHSEIAAEHEQTRRRLQQHAAALSSIRSLESATEQELKAARRSAVAAQDKTNATSMDIQRAELLSGTRFVDAAFLERAHNDLHQDTP